MSSISYTLTRRGQFPTSDRKGHHLFALYGERGGVACQHYVSVDDWDRLGRPNEITLTIEAGGNRHWMEEAERVHEGDYIGEDDNGDLWVQRSVYVDGLPGDRWVRFNRRRLSHLLTYWRSKRAGRVVWLEVSRG